MKKIFLFIRLSTMSFILYIALHSYCIREEMIEALNVFCIGVPLAAGMALATMAMDEDLKNK